MYRVEGIFWAQGGGSVTVIVSFFVLDFRKWGGIIKIRYL